MLKVFTYISRNDKDGWQEAECSQAAAAAEPLKDDSGVQLETQAVVNEPDPLKPGRHTIEANL